MILFQVLKNTPRHAPVGAEKECKELVAAVARTTDEDDRWVFTV